LTVNYGVRYDQHNGYAPASHIDAGLFTPAFDFPEVRDIPDFKDLSPRVSAAYDIFGTGKTALKASVGRYVTSQATGTTQGVAPAGQIVQNTSRTWADANLNYVPDCDLRNAAANGECGAISNRAFGTRQVTVNYADEVLRGWGNRIYNWQTSATLQHELRPG